MKKFFLVIILCISSIAYSQNLDESVTGKVQSETSELVLQNVHVINLTKVKGTITNSSGEFEIQAKVNDTLYFSYIGYKPIKIVVTNDLISKTKKISNSFNPAEYDTIVSSGEQISCALISGNLNHIGIKSRSWLSWQVPIYTQGNHKKSRITLQLRYEEIKPKNFRRSVTQKVDERILKYWKRTLT